MCMKFTVFLSLLAFFFFFFLCRKILLLEISAMWEQEFPGWPAIPPAQHRLWSHSSVCCCSLCSVPAVLQAVKSACPRLINYSRPAISFYCFRVGFCFCCCCCCCCFLGVIKFYQSPKSFQCSWNSGIRFRNENLEEFTVSIKELNFREICKENWGSMDRNRINSSHPIPLKWLCV